MRQIILAVAIILAAAGINGCHIDADRHGDSERVKIATPFGGLKVRTNDANAMAGIGLPIYSGATLVKKERRNGKGEDGAADVNMHFGNFQLKLKAVSYRTSDHPEQVLNFYRKALGRFGDVIQCDNEKPMGTPTHTSEGLTCDDDYDNSHVVSDLPAGDSNHDADLQLKAGSRKHQHIVAISSENNGTKFGLVALDLPGGFPFEGDSRNSEKKQ